MKRFVKLKLYDSIRNEYVERWFNIDFIRHIEPDRNKVHLNGASVPIVVSQESMESLMSEVANDAALQELPFTLSEKMPSLDSSEVAKLSAKVTVLHQALVGFVQLLRGKEPAILMQLGDETDDMIDLVYREIRAKLAQKQHCEKDVVRNEVGSIKNRLKMFINKLWKSS